MSALTPKKVKFSIFSKGRPLLHKKDIPAFVRMKQHSTYQGKVLVYKNKGIYYGVPIENSGPYNKAFTPIGSF